MAHPGTPYRQLALIAWVLLSACCARADSYLAKRSFEIPLVLSPGALPKQVILHVSTDGKTYSRAANVAPSAGKFEYTAAKDGWYSFIVQAESFTGQLDPPSIEGVPPLRVCVDTRRPEVELHPVRVPLPGRIAVEWEIKDENLDRRSLRLSYRSAGGDWTMLNPDQLDKAHFHWKPNGPGPYQARLEVNDLAGNISVKEVRVSGPAGAGAGGGADGPSRSSPGPTKTRFVRSRTFRLNYRIADKGLSGVKKIEVWMTRDKNQSYSRMTPDAKPDQSFYEVTVPVQGRYGFTLRPVSGVGRCCKAPEVGQEPQVWVQVDETPPQVFIHSATLSENGSDGGSLTVRYLATDMFLAPKPISVWFRDATNKAARWEEWQTSLENKSTVVLSTKGKPVEFELKVTAVDEANNRGSAVWKETIKNDPKEPKLLLEGVQGVEKPKAPDLPPGTPPSGAGDEVSGFRPRDGAPAAKVTIGVDAVEKPRGGPPVTKPTPPPASTAPPPTTPGPLPVTPAPPPTTPPPTPGGPPMSGPSTPPAKLPVTDGPPPPPPVLDGPPPPPGLGALPG